MKEDQTTPKILLKNVHLLTLYITVKWWERMDSNQLRFLCAGFTVPCPSAVRAALPKMVDLRGVEPRISPCKGDVLPLALEALKLWYLKRDLNPHAEALEPKSSVSANSTIEAKLKNARAGFEPTYTEPKSAVLPLDDQAIILFLLVI